MDEIELIKSIASDVNVIETALFVIIVQLMVIITILKRR